MAVRSLKLLGGGGAARGSEGHPADDDDLASEKGTCSQKGHFFSRLPGGSSPLLPPARYGPDIWCWILTESLKRRKRHCWRVWSRARPQCLTSLRAFLAEKSRLADADVCRYAIATIFTRVLVTVVCPSLSVIRGNKYLYYISANTTLHSSELVWTFPSNEFHTSSEEVKP